MDAAEAAAIARVQRTGRSGDAQARVVALAMGMVAVRYTGIDDDDSQPAPEGHHVVAHHGDLPAALGVG